MKKGWETKELAAVSAINYGYTESASSEPVGPRFLRITDIQDDRVDWDSVPYCKIEKADLPKYRLASGDIVFARTGATTGKSFLVNEPPDAVFASYLIRLRLLDKKLLPEFVLLFFQTAGYWQSIKDGSSGSAQGGFNATKLGALTLPVPPLAEQQRIVGLLDEAFEGLATAKANAEKNLQNARALFESHLQSVFTQRGPGWVEKNLGDLCEVFADGDWVESKDQSSEGIRLIQTGNVGQGVFKDRADKARYISEATFKRLRCTEIFDGDCLISRLPDPVGRSCILPDTGERMITAVDCTIVRFDQKQLLSKFFNHYSQSDDYIRTVAKECTGTTRNRISRSNLALTTIPVPPIAEQKRLASEFDSMREETQRLARLYELKHAALEALKKSLLHQAFTGEL